MTVAKPPHPLISSHPSTSGLKISLHPLALLTISDYVSRHTLRQIKGPIVGALLGSQNGREISIEHAYELKLIDLPVDDGKMDTDGEENVRVDESWFVQKLKQFKDVHPTLDFIGHFTYLPPPPNHLPRQLQLNIQTQLLAHNESLIFLALHPSALSTSAGGKLPLTIYESVYEEEGDTPESKVLKMKFTELDYTVETGEAEMIGVDQVAKGPLNAGDETGGKAAGPSGAVAKDEKPPVGTTATKEEGKKEAKGKGKIAESSSSASSKEEKEVTFESIALPTQTQELLSTLTAKANAVRMLHSRLTLLLAYLRNIESNSKSTSSTAATATTTTGADTQDQPKISYPLLRSLLSLTNRLPLLEPPATAESSLSSESLAELSDVHLVALLGAVTSSIEISKEVGRKFGAVEASRGGRERGGPGGGPGGPQGGMMEFGGYDSTGDDFGGFGGGVRGGLMGTLGGLLKNGGGGRMMGGRRF
ncbi:hypothetical protein TWF730_003182 [Orbilia blumenaviensis]|uniref:COP9 signalosome complex subunit 6 n=1 Tax=Orbilia blumenaviensis TaxID=1796055 RepID=A0AAV9U4X4_9PEZI